jgi:hypothetical protein
MFCPKCRCEFSGWTDSCPDCGVPLVQERPPDPSSSEKLISYASLVDLVKQRGGQLQLELSTTDIGTNKNRGFPYFGFGMAWANRMQGALDALSVDLATTEVGSEKTRSFPYQGRGFAWAKCMQGHIGGNEVTLSATQVARERTWRFPYLGYGYAWTEKMTGNCGDLLKAELDVTDVGRRREWGFPYFGFGQAWASRGTLVLSSRDAGEDGNSG